MSLTLNVHVLIDSPASFLTGLSLQECLQGNFLRAMAMVARKLFPMSH